MKFEDLPIPLLAEVARCKAAAETELSDRLIALRWQGLESFGRMYFTPDHPEWKAADALAGLKFGSARDFVDLEWSPCKYDGAWKISTNGWEGYVTTEQVCQFFGWKECPK